LQIKGIKLLKIGEITMFLSEKIDEHGSYHYEKEIEIEICNVDPEYEPKEKNVEVHVTYLIYFRNWKEEDREIRRVVCPYLKYISHGANYCTRCKNRKREHPTCAYDDDLLRIKSGFCRLPTNI
jgi:hypothetical protein